MSEMVNIFDFGSHVVRVHVVEDGSPFFVAKDVCDVLGIEKYRDAVARLDEDERGSVLVDTLGGAQQMGCVTESGLYHLIFKSRKAAAKKFRKWVTVTVLPYLRRKGFYSVFGGQQEFITLPDWLAAQDVDLSAEKVKATRLLRRAWDASKLLGYKRPKVNEESGLVEFPHGVLDFASEENIPELEDAVWTRFKRVAGAMVVERGYSVSEIAEIAGIVGSVAKQRSEVGFMMKRFSGVEVDGFRVVASKMNRRVYYTLEEVGS